MTLTAGMPRTKPRGRNCAAANPTVIIERPVRSHARNVRSFAIWLRARLCGCRTVGAPGWSPLSIRYLAIRAERIDPAAGVEHPAYQRRTRSSRLIALAGVFFSDDTREVNSE